jgi:hypothetical protein
VQRGAGLVFAGFVVGYFVEWVAVLAGVLFGHRLNFQLEMRYLSTIIKYTSCDSQLSIYT